MLDLNAVLNIVTLVLLALGGYALVLLKAGTEAAVKTSAEEAAKATIQQLQWPAELARELQKTRGVERQELRFKSYGALWKELRPLAIYDETVMNRKTVNDLTSKLSDWYFSECGGLLLTPQARDFYFALQDLLRATSRFPEDWDADRSGASEGDQKLIFQKVLKARGAEGAISVLDYLSTGAFEDWQNQAASLAKEWRKGINDVAASWKELDRRERFATLQQAGSVLRTSLTNDLDSRVR
jgi:hypothetical protein